MLVAVSTVVRSGTLLSDARYNRRITFEWTALIRRMSGLAALALAVVEVVALL